MEVQTSWWLVPLLIEATFRIISKGRIKPSVMIGTLLYGIFLILLRIYSKIYSKIQENRFQRATQAKELPKIARNATEASSIHRLKPMEVVSGKRGRRLVKTNYHKHHTLIASLTGGGKTNYINSMLVQFFSKGAEFTDVADVYLFDLKGVKEDYLHLWKPVVKGYFSITAEGSGINKAIKQLEEVADLLKKPKRKHAIVIIDEVASLTSFIKDPQIRHRSEATLDKLAMQLRSRGTLIIATQYPKFDIIGRGVTSNLPRKIGFMVDDVSQGELIFRSRPKEKDLPRYPGEFLVKEPGTRGLISGKSFLVNLPDEINNAVKKVLDTQMQGDVRLEFLGKMIANKEVGASLLGVNKLSGNGSGVRQGDALSMQRNFVAAGALIPPSKRGQPHKLAVSYAEAFGLVKKYIDDGRWVEGLPPSLTK